MNPVAVTAGAGALMAVTGGAGATENPVAVMAGAADLSRPAADGGPSTQCGRGGPGGWSKRA